MACQPLVFATIKGWVHAIQTDPIKDRQTYLEYATYGANCCLISAVIVPVIGGVLYYSNKVKKSNGRKDDDHDKETNSAILGMLGFLGGVALFYGGAMGILYGLSGICACWTKKKYPNHYNDWNYLYWPLKILFDGPKNELAYALTTGLGILVADLF